MNLSKNITGVILAGGQSSRFGSDKARVCLKNKNKPVILELHHKLSRLGVNVIVVADTHDKYKDIGLSCVVDLIPKKGPLGGIYTALKSVKTDKVLVLTCDMPVMTSKLLKKLIDRSVKTNKNIVCETGDDLQPFPGIYLKSSLHLLEDLIKSDRLSVKGFLTKSLDQKGLSKIVFNKRTQDFFNMNFIKDYKTLVLRTQRDL